MENQVVVSGMSKVEMAKAALSLAWSFGLAAWVCSAAATKYVEYKSAKMDLEKKKAASA